MKKELLSYHPKRWARGVFSVGGSQVQLGREEASRVPRRSRLFLSRAEGLVYPCLTIPSPMGDLKGHSFEEVWESEQAEKVRGEIGRL